MINIHHKGKNLHIRQFRNEYRFSLTHSFCLIVYVVKMKLNIANPATGLLKSVDIEDANKLLPFFDKSKKADFVDDFLIFL
jgi:hypothetical protein